MGLDAHAVTDLQRRLPCKDRRPGIAFLLGIVPILLIARQVQLYLPRLAFTLLDAEDIRIRFPEKIRN